VSHGDASSTNLEQQRNQPKSGTGLLVAAVAQLKSFREVPDLRGWRADSRLYTTRLTLKSSSGPEASLPPGGEGPCSLAPDVRGAGKHAACTHFVYTGTQAC
jgi:hypothetical protein